MAPEVELKLEIDQGHAAKIGSHPLVRGIEPQIERQLSVYYDTPRGKIRKNGWTLRVRQSGTRYVQTIKRAGDHAGLFSREEWEVEVTGLAPEFDAAAWSPLASVLGPRQFANLAAVFRTDMERTTWLIERDGAVIELVSDSGEIATDDAAQHVEELELELKQGEVAALFAVARQLARKIPVRLGVLSKAERGLGLARGVQGVAAKAESVHILGVMPVADGFPVIVAACLKHFRMNEDLVVREHSAEALHQARVALRRLRSALSLFGPAVHDSEFADIRGELRDVMRLMGAARNVDVMLADLPSDDPRRQRMERDRGRYYAKVGRALGSKSFRDLMLSIIGWAFDGEWRTSRQANLPLMDFAVGRLDRIWQKFEERGIYLAALSDRKRHQLRIDAKKLRYALEFFREPLRNAGPTQRKFVRMAEGLQNSFGRLNDLAIALDHGAVGMDGVAIAVDEAREMRAAGRYFRQMREIGPYWREATAG